MAIIKRPTALLALQAAGFAAAFRLSDCPITQSGSFGGIGATLDLCTQFDSFQGGKQVNLFFSDVQQVSLSSICDNFRNDVQADHGSVVNCNENNGIVTIGVNMGNGKSAGDVLRSFACTLEKDIDTNSGRQNAQCHDSILAFKKRSETGPGDSVERRQPMRIERRVEIDGNSVPNDFDTFKDASANTFFIESIETYGEPLVRAAAESSETMANGFSALAQTLGSQGGATIFGDSRRFTSQGAQRNQFELLGEYDAAVSSNGAGPNLGPSQWTVLISALFRKMKAQGRQTVAMVVATAAAGTVATISLSVRDGVPF